MKVFKLCKPSKHSKDWLSQNCCLLTFLQVAWTCPHIKWFRQITAQNIELIVQSAFSDILDFLLFCMCWLDIFKLLFIWHDGNEHNNQTHIKRCVLGAADGSQCRDLGPKLARIGVRVGLCEAHSTNPSSSMVDGVSVDGLMTQGKPWRATINEISSSFDLEHDFGKLTWEPGKRLEEFETTLGDPRKNFGATLGKHDIIG